MKCYPATVTLLICLILVLQGCVVADDSSLSAKGKSKQAESHYLLGMSHLGENNPSKAIQELVKAEEFDSKSAKIQASLAQAYMQKRAYGLAEQHLLKAIDLSKGNPDYTNNLGALYLTMQRYDEAIKAFETAKDDLTFQMPEVAWSGIGYAYFQKKDYAAAEQAYKKSSALNGRYAQAHFRLGEIYYMQDRPVEALEAFQKTVALSPVYVPGHYWLGLTYMKTRETGPAVQSFKEVIRLAPDSEEARLSRNYLKILVQ